MAEFRYPVGKIPVDLLSRLIIKAPHHGTRIILGPGVGLDCAVIDNGSSCLVLKSDPITFASDEIGWYLVQVNANDLATTGALPRWLLLTALFPDRSTTTSKIESIFNQVYLACDELNIAVIGGHTEITSGITHPILVGTLIGEVEKNRLITPKGAQIGDRILLTKGVPIEATTLLAREFTSRLDGILTPAEISTAQGYLHQPGISVVRDAQLACQFGRVTAMHDPTEGGVITALWELAEACNHTIILDPTQIHIPELCRRICQVFKIDPLRSLASGALLLTVTPGDAINICQGLINNGIFCSEIGRVEAGPANLFLYKSDDRFDYSRPTRDEIAKLFE